MLLVWSDLMGVSAHTACSFFFSRGRLGGHLQVIFTRPTILKEFFLLRRGSAWGARLWAALILWRGRPCEPLGQLARESTGT